MNAQKKIKIYNKWMPISIGVSNFIFLELHRNALMSVKVVIICVHVFVGLLATEYITPRVCAYFSKDDTK